MELHLIGVDPGPLTGITQLRLVRDEPAPARARLDGVGTVQVSWQLALLVLDGLRSHGAPMAVAMERFVIGARTARSKDIAASRVTLQMIELIGAWCAQHGIPRVLRSAAEVKPWATDIRLGAAGITPHTEGMRHARDAGRHALFSTVRDHGLPDPLSRKGSA